MEQMTWFVLSHQVPVTPSKKRVYVWRKLKEIGATYFRQGVAMLPKTPSNFTRFQTLSTKIIEMGGEAVIAEMRFLDIKDEQRAIAEFRQQSREEYKKIISEITALNKEIAGNKEVAQGGRDRAKKLERTLKKILARDYFQSRQEPEVFGLFNELLRDMSQVTQNLERHIAKALSER